MAQQSRFSTADCVVFLKVTTLAAHQIGSHAWGPAAADRETAAFLFFHFRMFDEGQHFCWIDMRAVMNLTLRRRGFPPHFF